MTEPADLHILIVEEQAHVAKRAVAKERVRVRTEIDTREELVTDTVIVEALDIERRPVERLVPAPPPPRQEGDATIISIVEERLVVTKHLYVVEEVIVRRVASQEPVCAPVTLRAMRAVVERDFAPQQETN